MFSTALALSTTLVITVGDILVQNTTPLTLFVKPMSVILIGNNCLTMGQKKSTDPPPSGAAPLFFIVRVASPTPKFFKKGNVTFRTISTDRSIELLVMPAKFTDRLSLAKTARGIMPYTTRKKSAISFGRDRVTRKIIECN